MPMFEDELRLESIQGGAINKSYILHCGDDRFFLKTFESNHFAPTDRQALFFHQQRLAELQKAPHPIYLSNAHDFQVEAYVEHTSLRQSDLTETRKLRLLAETLYEIHQLPTIAMSLDLPKDWVTYLEKAAKKDDKKLLKRIESIKQSWIETHKADQVLCHNDLAMEHISVTMPPVIFDWEYAAVGNRYFDLVACSLINQLSDHAIDELLGCYSEFSDISLLDVKQQYVIQLPIVKLTNELWYLAAQTRQQD